MKKFLLLLGALLAASLAAQAENPRIHVMPVEAWVRSVVVSVDGAEIPSQLDDLDGDGVFDELCFVVEDTGTPEIAYSRAAADPDRYPRRVDAYMQLKTATGSEPRTEICAPEDNMYNQVLPHGPAFESELVAYRLYFDRKQTVDLYGKYTPGLELNRTLFYPTDAQLAAGAGDDVIRVFNSVGVGTLRGYDPAERKSVMMAPMKRRCARIVANGPVRVVVEMIVEGWEYGGRSVDMRSRYLLYAGHRDCLVENTIIGGEGLPFCTGVMKMAEHTAQIDPEAGYAAVWGTDWPVNDTIKFAKQTVGIAMEIAPERIEQSLQNAEDYLFVMTPDARGRIDYRITFVAAKERFGAPVKTAEAFFDYVSRWAAEE